MPIKTKEELFGDNATHGPQVPISVVAPPDHNASVRAIAFGQELTAATTNRICYALALNDEDLDERMVYFEEHGLDGVYRLGLADVAGGGRTINVDGGAVEAISELTDNLAFDSANASFRANTYGDTSDGSIGFDFVARSGSVSNTAPGRALFGIVDRRALIVSTTKTKLTASVAVTLNLDGIAADEISIIGAPGTAFWSGGVPGGGTDLVPGLDMVEILTGDFAGLYLLTQINNETSAKVVCLDGSTPAFTTAAAATMRVYRPVFATAGAQGRASSGITIAGVPGDVSGDAAALTLVPGGRRGKSSVTTEQGNRYALKVRVLGPLPADDPGYAGITAAGGFETAAVLAGFNADAVVAKDFGWPGYRYDSANGYLSTGFLAHSKGPSSPFYGFVVQGRPNTGGAAATGAGAVLTVAAGNDYLVSTPGALVEVFLSAVSVGVFRLLSSAPGGGGTQLLTLRCFDGTSPTLPGGALTVHVLHGATAGAGALTSASALLGIGLTTDSVTTVAASSKATMDVTGPIDESDAAAASWSTITPAALRLAGQSANPNSLLIRGTNRQDGETFLVTATGRVSAKEAVRSPLIITDAIRLRTETTIADIPIPLSLMSYQGARAVAGVLKPVWERPAVGAWALNPGGTTVPSGTALMMPITGVVPYGLELTILKVYYETSSYLTDQSFQLKVYKRDQFDDASVQIATGVLTANASPGTFSLAIPAGNFASRNTAELFALITNTNLTAVPHDSNIMIVHGAYATGKLKDINP